MTVSEDWDRQRAARRSLADAIEPRFDHLSRKAVEKIADWILANGPYVSSVLGSLTSGEREKEQLQQQRVASLSDEEVLLEDLHLAEQDVKRLRGLLTAMGSRYVPKLLERDEVGADEDDRRISEEIAAEKAIQQAPRLAG